MLLNGLPAWITGTGGSRKYKPVRKNEDGDNDSDDDAEDPQARRKMMELSSFGGSKSSLSKAKPEEDKKDTKQADKGSFPMTSFNR